MLINLSIVFVSFSFLRARSLKCNYQTHTTIENADTAQKIEKKTSEKNKKKAKHKITEGRKKHCG